MHRIALVTLVIGGLAACSRSPSVSGQSAVSEQPSKAPRSGDGEPAVSQPGTFRATKTGDLAAPLQRAFESARNDGAGIFTLELAPGVYTGSIDLTDPRDTSSLTLVVTGTGPGPAVIAGGTIKLDAAAITLRNIVVDGAKVPAAPVRIRVETRATLEAVSVVDSAVADPQMNDPIVEIRASRGGTPSAEIRNCWFVRNRSASRRGAALDFSADPGRTFSTIELDDVVFAGNETAYSLRPRYAASARLRGVVFVEPAVGSAAIYLNSPRVKLSIDGGMMAGAKRAVEYMINDDAKRGDYTTATMTGTHVRLAAPIPTDDVAQAGVHTEPAGPPPSWDAIAAAARTGEKPTLARLGL